MSDLRAAAQQALEALQWYAECSMVVGRAEAAITALRAALAEPLQEELKPKLGKRAIKAFEAALAQVEKETAHAAEDWRDTTQMGYVVKPYTAPPQRKPLTQEEIDHCWYESGGLSLKFARAIERAHGIGGQDES